MFPAYLFLVYLENLVVKLLRNNGLGKMGTKMGAKNKFKPRQFFKVSIAILVSLLVLIWGNLPKAGNTGNLEAETLRRGISLESIAVAQTCVAGVNCPPPRVEFVPGQRIRVEISNLTQTLVYAEKVQGEPPIDVIPGQMSFFVTSGSSINNLSLVIWDNRGSILTLRPVKVDNNTLRVEVRAGNTPPGDRTVYLRNDGRVLVL